VSAPLAVSVTTGLVQVIVWLGLAVTVTDGGVLFSLTTMLVVLLHPAMLATITV